MVGSRGLDAEPSGWCARCLALVGFRQYQPRKAGPWQITRWLARRRLFEDMAARILTAWLLYSARKRHPQQVYPWLLLQLCIGFGAAYQFVVTT